MHLVGWTAILPILAPHSPQSYAYGGSCIQISLTPLRTLTPAVFTCVRGRLRLMPGLAHSKWRHLGMCALLAL